jgi:alpha-beta hydrolase superfamily lysophospholipase
MGTEEILSFADADGHRIAASRWMPEREPKAVVQVAHGWAEHRRRYGGAALVLNAAGYGVYADDHLGHGETGLGAGGLGDFRPRGMAGVVHAVHDLTVRIRRDLPDVPVYLLGHSWGSQIARRYARLWGTELAGLLLTGAGYEGVRPARDLKAGPDVSPEERYSWLSGDPAAVRAYMEDPLCGFEAMEVRPADPGRAFLTEGDDGALPSDLPVLIFNGADDPVGGEEAAEALGRHYRDCGLARVTARSYPDGRHELFNDVMRDRVLADVVEWLNEHTPADS